MLMKSVGYWQIGLKSILRVSPDTSKEIFKPQPVAELHVGGRQKRREDIPEKIPNTKA
jgi:hypothetical protein